MTPDYQHTDVENATLRAEDCHEYAMLVIEGQMCYLTPKASGELVLWLVKVNAYLDAGQRAELQQLLHEKS